MSNLGPPRVVNIADLRRLAQRRLPKVVFDYLDGGAEGEVTLRENSRVFEDVPFRPRQAVAIEKCDLSTRVLGHETAFPAMLAPVWYQLYLVGGRAAAERAMERIRVAGFSALVITVDTAVAGMRERDPRNGMKQLLGGSLLAKIPFVPDIVSHPAWLSGFLLDGGVPKLENIVLENNQAMTLMDVSAALAASVVEWADLQWLRKAWPGPILVKGVLTGDDARRAVDEGAAGVIVSNHGGRQLDGVSASLRALPEIVAAVGGRTE